MTTSDVADILRRLSGQDGVLREIVERLARLETARAHDVESAEHADADARARRNRVSGWAVAMVGAVGAVSAEVLHGFGHKLGWW